MLPVMTYRTFADRHLRNLSLLHYGLGGLLALLATLPLAHAVIEIAMSFAPHAPGGDEAEPAAVNSVFIAGSIFILLLGWGVAGATAYAGHCLASRKHHAFCLSIAALNLGFVPIGTALGLYSFFILLRPSVRALFTETSDGGRPETRKPIPSGS